MNVLLDGKDITSCVRQMFSAAEEIKCAVAFWGSGAEELLKSARAKDIKILCNLMLGGTNPHVVKAIKSIIGTRGNVKHSSTLHAKVYIADNSALIGSANASANGMALEGAETSGFNEACIYTEDRKTVEKLRQWFTSLYSSCDDVEDKDIAEAQRTWKMRRNRRVIVAPHNSSLLVKLEKNPDSFKDKNIFLALYNHYADKDAYDAFSDWSQDNLTSQGYSSSVKDGIKQNISFYQSWENIPDDALLIDIYCGPKGGFSFHGIFHIPQGRQDVHYKNSEGEKEFLTLCNKQQDFRELGMINLKFRQDDKKTLKQRLPVILKSYGANLNDGVLVSLYEAKDLILSDD